MIKVVPMQEEHIEGVLAVEEASFSIPWSRKDFEREIKENKMAIYFVAMDEDKIVGYAGMWHVVTEGHITNVAVLYEYRRQGIGELLMQNLELMAKEREMIGITLEVRINNEPAQRLYHKYGFRPEGIRKNYYADTHEDAVIMWKYYPVFEGYEEHCKKG